MGRRRWGTGLLAGGASLATFAVLDEATGATPAGFSAVVLVVAAVVGAIGAYLVRT